MTNRLPLILRSDGYKVTQWLQYPPDTDTISSYIEARGGGENSVFFGLQAFIKEYLLTPITMADIDFAEAMLLPYIGYFNREGWEHIVNEYGGYVPVTIEAVPEGTVMPTSNIQVQVANIGGPATMWVTSYIETALLRGVWYPSTVATKSWNIKQHLLNAINVSSDVPAEELITFMLHDFGARGVSSGESAVLGGMAHLLNFRGTDTMEGMYGAYKYYKGVDVANSIPASEHSTMTSWGRENESTAYKNMLEVFSGEGKLLAVVSDSYDIYHAVRHIWGEELKEQVINNGGRIVIRPDSGSPFVVPIEVIKILMEQFGYTINSKGYKVLPDFIRVIQGDGITEETMPRIIINMIDNNLSIENIAFGMGGGLLQEPGRDDYQYAMKASARKDTNGVWHDVFKDPLHGNKVSKKGRLGITTQCGLGSCSYRTLRKEYIKEGYDLLEPVYITGKLLRDTSFEEVSNTVSKGVTL